jgi:indolepyruvate ferredoxin oxidoreductase alpha subunit
LLAAPGLRLLVLRQECALVRAHHAERRPPIRVEPTRCIGDACGCGRLCTRVFRCPGLVWDPTTRTTRVDAALCTGCGVCAQICPTRALVPEAPPC